MSALRPQPPAALRPDWRPPHAHLPGITPRHDEALFDAIKAGAEDTAPAELTSTNAWRFGLIFLREGYFWEAHEVLEPLWMAAPPNGPDRMLLQGIIQLANAGLKRAMGRAGAAARLFAQAEDLAAEAFSRGGRHVLGLAAADFSALRDSLPDRASSEVNV